jgi:hypothetical protein
MTIMKDEQIIVERRADGYVAYARGRDRSIFAADTHEEARAGAQAYIESEFVTPGTRTDELEDPCPAHRTAWG